MGKNRGKKQNGVPSPKENPSNQKQVRKIEEPPSFHSRRPSWRIAQLELAEPFGWHKLDPNSVSEIRVKLAHFESMTWSEILVKDKKHNHSVPINKLCKLARDRLIEIRQDDVDELVSLHLSGQERVWGILEEGVLRLLWWDPEHEVCPSYKKHT